ncbi:hypothetical protein AVEN_263844-1 [Araneus ventricosus]|uniref:Uncharacterized protein n=1 Tax=Araneus ventricosus TaxID=182803 RepID=A0A4Y2E298_ARAVE|nr:hypothetical protein AVEN_263844-1 [Araneus ventricosus]
MMKVCEKRRWNPILRNQKIACSVFALLDIHSPCLPLLSWIRFHWGTKSTWMTSLRISKRSLASLMDTIMACSCPLPVIVSDSYERVGPWLVMAVRTPASALELSQ